MVGYILLQKYKDRSLQRCNDKIRVLSFPWGLQLMQVYIHVALVCTWLYCEINYTKKELKLAYMFTLLLELDLNT